MSAAAQKVFLVGSVFCVTFAAAATLSQVQPSGHTPDVSMKIEEARSSPGRGKPAVMRREQMLKTHDDVDKVWRPAKAIFAEISANAGHHQAAGTETYAESKNADLYVLAGKARCDGDGMWKGYKLEEIRPGKYSYSAAACDSKEECVGFDIGPSGSRLYTTKPVAVGSWPDVFFKDGHAFPGTTPHDAYVSSPDELKPGSAVQDEHWECYRKTFYKPRSAYYYTIGDGTCSGGGLWKRYVVLDGVGGGGSAVTYMQCEDACSIRDECVGFDFGTWLLEENTTQEGTDSPYFVSTSVTKEGCHMYTQKAVWGTWPGVQNGKDVEDGTTPHDAFPAKPDELKNGTIPKFNVARDQNMTDKIPTECYGKAHYVGLDSYYIELGKNLCAGGGTGYGEHKHYKAVNVKKSKCQEHCDEQDACVGYDYDKKSCSSHDGCIVAASSNDEKPVCRLYTNKAIQKKEDWEGVDFGTNDEAFPGVSNSDVFASSPFELIPLGGKVDGVTCTVKTHFETEGQPLAENENR